MAWPVLAAAVLLALGVGFLAMPGHFSVGLPHGGPGVHPSPVSGAADRTRLHLHAAEDALRALDAAVVQQAGERAYGEALATFQVEERAATAALGSVPAGADHDALAAQLEALRSRARGDLRIALPALGWPARLDTTMVLRDLGESAVPQLGRVSLSGASHDGEYIWIVTVTGSGFQPGAILLVNGQRTGRVISTSPTLLTAEISGKELTVPPGSIGVGNPDGTAAATTSVSGGSASDGHETPGGEEHHGGGDDR